MFTLLFLFIYSFLLSFSFLHVSRLTTSPSLLSSSIDPQTLLSSSETYCWSAQAQLPQTHRRRPTFGLSSLFSAFWLCVSSCACVSALCFRLCLCFELGFYFRHGFRFLFRARFVFQAVIFLFFFFFFLLHWFWWARRGCGCAVIFMGLMVVEWNIILL